MKSFIYSGHIVLAPSSLKQLCKAGTGANTSIKSVLNAFLEASSENKFVNDVETVLYLQYCAFSNLHFEMQHI